MLYQALWATLVRDQRWEGEIWNRRKDGDVYLQWTAISAVPGDNGKPARYVSVFHDVTEARNKDERIRHLAFHDVLTGLPNRALFRDRLAHAVRRSRREDELLSVTFIDLDGFKTINDTLGHDVGDQLLQEVASRITARMRRGADTVARLGGDEFVVLMEDLKETEHCATQATAMIADIAQPMTLRGRTVRVGASMGMAFFPKDADTAQELMQRADTALYAAKASGKGTYRFFNTEMHAEVARRMTIEEELGVAINRGELVLHYQPKISSLDGSLQGLEALVRWQHPVRGLLPPGEFLPLAEESDLILHLGEWVLAEVCRQAAAWRAQQVFTTIAFNVSTRQLYKGNLIEQLETCLSRYDIPASGLQIELTETALMADMDCAIEILGQVRAMGMGIAVDDFGTGYSSLSRLRSLPIDLLKIDRSFVAKLDQDEKDIQVVRTIITLARNLGLDVVAEGVESEAQAKILREAGCPICQGYLFGRPQPAEQLVDLLRQGACDLSPHQAGG